MMFRDKGWFNVRLALLLWGTFVALLFPHLTEATNTAGPPFHHTAHPSALQKPVPEQTSPPVRHKQWLAFVVDHPSRPQPPRSYPTKRGLYATGRADPDGAEQAWLSRFAIVESGDLWDSPGPAQRELMRRGVRVLGYDWMPAMYHYLDGSPDPPLAAWLYRNRDWASLNPQGPFPHCEEEGYDWCEDYYFDYGHSRVRNRKARAVAGALEKYSGVFFDWAPGVFIEEDVYAPLQQTFARRHPDLTYQEAVGHFYQTLRARVGDGLVVTNQGFRNAENVLPHVDWDITESYATTDMYLGRRLNVLGRGRVDVPDTIYFPVSADFRRGSLSDTLEWLHYLDRVGRAYGGPRFQGFIYLNYAAPSFVPVGNGLWRAEVPKNAILYGYAVPRLLGYTAYTEVPFDHTLERFPVYQADLGRPLGTRYEKQGGAYVRFYQNGLVLVGHFPGPVRVRISSPWLRKGWLYDFYTGKWIRAETGSLTVDLIPESDPVTGRTAPVGRVWVYGR